MPQGRALLGKGEGHRQPKIGAIHPSKHHSQAQPRQACDREQGKYPQPRNCSIEVVKGQTATEGRSPQHPRYQENTSRALYQDWGSTHRTRSCTRKCEGRHNQGADHSTPFITMNSLASCISPGEFQEAEKLYKEELKGLHQNGAIIPTLWLPRGNLAGVPGFRDVRAGRDLFKEVVEAATGQLRPDHPNTLPPRTTSQPIKQKKLHHEEVGPAITRFAGGAQREATENWAPIIPYR